MTNQIELRDVIESDLPIFYKQQRALEKCGFLAVGQEWFSDDLQEIHETILKLDAT